MQKSNVACKYSRFSLLLATSDISPGGMARSKEERLYLQAKSNDKAVKDEQIQRKF